MPDWISGAVGSLLVGGFTLLGIWLSNRHSRQIQDAQLKHDSEARRIERQYAVKRELYLSYMREFALLNTSLANLVTKGDNPSAVEDILAKYTSVASQVQLVSSPQICLLINEFYQPISKALRDVAPIFLRIAGLTASIKINEGFYEKYSGHIDHIINEMKRANAHALENKDVILSELDRQYQQEEIIRNDLSVRQDRNRAEIANLQMEYSRIYLENAKQLNSAFGEIFIALREEMGAENSDTLLQDMLEGFARRADYIAEFLKEMERMVKVELEGEGDSPKAL